MKRKLLASACALCTFSVLAGIAAAQFNPNSPAPSQSPSNVPSPGSLLPTPGNTNIGIPSQNIPGRTINAAPTKATEGLKKPPGVSTGTKTARPDGAKKPSLATGGQLQLSKGVEEHIRSSDGPADVWRLWEKLRDIVKKGPDILADPLGRPGRDTADLSKLAERLAPARPGEAKNRKAGEGRGIESARAGPAGPRDPSGAASQGWGVISDTGPGPFRIVRSTNDAGHTRRTETHNRQDGTDSATSSTWARDSNGRTTRQDYTRDTYYGPDGKLYTTTSLRSGHVEVQDGESVWVTESTTTTTDSKGNIVVADTQITVVPYDAGEVYADWDDPDSGSGGGAPEKLVDDGTRIRFHGVFCHPIRGCGGINTSNPSGLRVNPGPGSPDSDRPTPASVAGSSTAPGPGAVTDPNPEEIGRGAGGGSTPPDPCRYAKGPGCTDEPQGTGTGGPTR